MSEDKIEILRSKLDAVSEQKTLLENELRSELMKIAKTEDNIIMYLWQYINVGNNTEFDYDFSQISENCFELNIFDINRDDMVDETMVTTFCEKVYEVVESEDMGNQMRFILKRTGKEDDCCHEDEE